MYFLQIPDIQNDSQMSMVGLLGQSSVFMRCGNYRNVAFQFETRAVFFNSIPQELLTGAIGTNEAGYAVYYLSSPVLTAYLHLHEVRNAKRVSALIRQINAVLLPMLDREPDKQTRVALAEYFAAFYVAMYEADYGTARHFLDQIDGVLQAGEFRDSVNVSVGEHNLFDAKIRYFLSVQQNDRAAYYLERYESQTDLSDGQKYLLRKNKARLYRNLNLYEEANRVQNEAIEYLNVINSKQMAEMDELLYSHIEAEYNAIELEKAERAKQNRFMWILISSTLAVAAIGLVYCVMLRQNKKAKAKISNLNDTVNEQIAAMEEKKYRSVRKEQQRLGQDLHDSFSGSVAALKHRVDILRSDTDDEALKPVLANVSAQLAATYETVRAQSHKWVTLGEDLDGRIFEKHVYDLVKDALPEKYYHTEIHIDDYTFSQTTPTTRIAVLRIIQETVTGIIRQNTTAKVSLLMYEESGEILLSVKNYHAGLTDLSNAKKFISGMQAVKKRITNLGGKMETRTDSSGIEIILSIPAQ